MDERPTGTGPMNCQLFDQVLLDQIYSLLVKRSYRNMALTAGTISLVRKNTA